MSRMFYHQTRMRLHITFPMSKLELGNMMVKRFGGRLLKRGPSLSYRMDSVKDFKRLLRALKPLTTKIDVPQVNILILAIQQHIEHSTRSCRTHRMNELKRSHKILSTKTPILDDL